MGEKGFGDIAAKLGPCCICARSDYRTAVILMLEKKAPIAGRGWGCVQCGLPPDGAIAVVCDICATQEDTPLSEKSLTFACRGYPSTDGRVPVGELTGEHRHDEALHPEEPDGT